MVNHIKDSLAGSNRGKFCSRYQENHWRWAYFKPVSFADFIPFKKHHAVLIFLCFLWNIINKKNWPPSKNIRLNNFVNLEWEKFFKLGLLNDFGCPYHSNSRLRKCLACQNQMQEGYSRIPRFKSTWLTPNWPASLTSIYLN